MRLLVWHLGRRIEQGEGVGYKGGSEADPVHGWFGKLQLLHCRGRH